MCPSATRGIITENSLHLRDLKGEEYPQDEPCFWRIQEAKETLIKAAECMSIYQLVADLKIGENEECRETR